MSANQHPNLINRSIKVMLHVVLLQSLSWVYNHNMFICAVNIIKGHKCQEFQEYLEQDRIAPLPFNHANFTFVALVAWHTLN